VNCGNRSELEPAISANNCPRLYGTFQDETDCTAFFNCRNGLANRYNCAPGLAFDPSDRVCKWADQVDACKKMMNEEEKAQDFTCPKTFKRGIYSKHAHPQDCRQYFVCIAGNPREIGCPLGSVFKITSSGQDGVCANPIDVPECANYYGDLEFGNDELVKAGVDPEVLGIDRQRSQSGQRVPSNSFSSFSDFDDDNDFASFDEPILVPAIIPARAKPIEKINTNRAQPPQFRNKPQSIPVPTQAPTTTTTTTTTRRTTTRRPTPTTTFAPAAAIITTEAQELNTEFNTEAPEILSDKLVDIIDTIEEVDGDNPNRPQPAVVKAGEDYYYYYYYYDDDETLPDEDA